MERLTQNYEKFMEGKESNTKGEELFNKTLKKASKPRGSK